jgi:hypothetical protein
MTARRAANGVRNSATGSRPKRSAAVSTVPRAADSGDTNSQEEDKDQDEQDPQPASSLRAETAESQGPLSGTSESGGGTHGKAAVLFYIRISCIAVE